VQADWIKDREYLLGGKLPRREVTLHFNGLTYMVEGRPKDYSSASADLLRVSVHVCETPKAKEHWRRLPWDASKRQEIINLIGI